MIFYSRNRKFTKSPQTASEEQEEILERGKVRRRKNVTYLDHVERKVGLGRQRIQVKPRAGEPRQAVLEPPGLGHVDNGGDVVLLHHGEARAGHGSVDKTLPQRLVEYLLVAAVGDGRAQQPDQREAGVVDGVALAQRDQLRHGPGELAYRADHALVWALGAVAGEGGLILDVSVSEVLRWAAWA